MEKYSLVTVTRNSEKVFNLISEILLFGNSEWLQQFIIVDNNSDEEFLAQLAKYEAKFEKIKLIKRDKNYLYSDSNNYGINYIFQNSKEEKVIILINPDISTINEIDKLQQLVATMSLTGAKIAGCKLLFPNWKIEHAGGKDNGHIGYNQENTDYYNKMQEVEWVTGALLAVEKEVFETVGLLDAKTFPHWVSDQEFCRRAGLYGIKTFYIPIEFEHSQGSSTRRSSHEECKLDLPEGVVPNTIPVSLEYIKEIANKNYQTKPE